MEWWSTDYGQPMRGGSPKSAQIVIPGAEHCFRDRDLLETISDRPGGL